MCAAGYKENGKQVKLLNATMGGSVQEIGFSFKIKTSASTDHGSGVKLKRGFDLMHTNAR